MQKQHLKINPLLKPKHLIYYFQVSQPTSTRIFKDIKFMLSPKLPTFEDFFHMYGTFPDPKFKPIWQ